MQKYFSDIPRSLRCVAPFLEEAQSILSTHKDDDFKEMRVVIHFIDSCIKLICIFALNLDAAAIKLLEEYKAHREVLVELLKGTGLVAEEDEVTPSWEINGERPSAEGALIAEANAILTLAQAQYDANMTISAARNSHTASLFFRVLQSIAPHLAGEISGKIRISSSLTRKCSQLEENFVSEHFEGHSCADYYETMGGASQLGVGSYGSVYSCKCKKTGDIFACKVIGLNRINSHYLRKLHLEIAIMKEVTHPNIIRVREVFFGSRTVYIIMEMCKGGELFAQLTNNFKKGFPELQVALLMRDMISSIRYLHSRNIVHRDIKLENYLFVENGSDQHLKLIDFGLSKYCAPTSSMHQVVGSAYYTAPEVLCGNYDHRCDIWSLGVVAYMLLSGSPPFYGDCTEEIHSMTANDEASFPLKRFGKITSGCIDFVKKMLTKDPNKRMSLEESLKHPFINSANNYVADPSPQAAPLLRKPYISAPPTDVIIALGQYVQADVVKKFVMETVSFAMKVNELSELADDYYSMDETRTGYISIENINNAVTNALATQLEELSISNIALLKKLAGEFPSMDQNIKVTFPQYAAAVTCKRVIVSDMHLSAAFSVLDVNGDGKLTVDSFTTILGIDSKHVDANMLIQVLDSNKIGYVDFQSFTTYWRNLQNLYALQDVLTPSDNKSYFLSKPIRKMMSTLSNSLRTIGSYAARPGGSILRSVTTSSRVATTQVRLPPIAAPPRRLGYEESDMSCQPIRHNVLPQRVVLPSISNAVESIVLGNNDTDRSSSNVYATDSKQQQI